MNTYLLGWLLCLYGAAVFPTPPFQVETSIRIHGSCKDNTTKEDIKKSVVYAVAASGKRQAGKSDETGHFDVRVSDSTQFLSFEVEGYHTVTVPVNFIGRIASTAAFPVYVEMSRKDSLPLSVINQLIISFSVPDSMDIDHRTASLTSTFFSVLSFRKQNNNGRHWPFYQASELRPGRYRYTASSTEGRLYFTKDLTLAPGFNFMDVRFDTPKEPSETVSQPEVLNEIVVKSLQKRFLYFDQSSYELRKETKAELDQVARFLANEPDMVAHVTGFTDHVGDKNKNLTLSEFRAKTVMNYLTQKGLRAEQIIVSWKGAVLEDSTNDSEESKIKKRRVEVQMMPK
ncbi:OmpA family protein [Runella slithyformis]|uniref:OmpA/MotB domain protein n=1 Tax=Runella slithyformis (strain ATCC 29530 / DSM 19594 / LMG 11500 / NCIMB 11436 / LSU 4) TaxID=761193 RepID=A0A7U4E665_RUNSL|nr:OmpA family protein [Runella slithyformis]AEI49218.1 OmpA/MotB domain protein [Runella slithyformis DSM 19594]